MSIEEYFKVLNADIITFQECGNTTILDVQTFLNTNPIYYPYIYPSPSSTNLTLSKYPSIQSWEVADRIDADLIDLPDSIYATDILILNGHPNCCGNNQARQENFDAFIQFILDAKTPGGVIDLPINTPISFSGDMNLVGYAEQYYTIINGTISDTDTFGPGGFPDWDDTSLEDQICYFNEKNVAYTWDKSDPSSGDFPPGRLDFVFFTNSVMSVDKSFILSTEHMSESLLTENNLYWDDTKNASDHFPIIVDFVLPLIIQGCTDEEACNYYQDANVDDGSCEYAEQYYDCEDNCINDLDLDEVCDELDNCPEDYNPNQEDFNFDGLGDACDGIGLFEESIEKKLIQITDLLGREILSDQNKGNLLLYIYDDGSIERKYLFDNY